ARRMEADLPGQKAMKSLRKVPPDPVRPGGALARHGPFFRKRPGRSRLSKPGQPCADGGCRRASAARTTRLPPMFGPHVIYGQHYPRELQETVAHGERFAELLTRRRHLAATDAARAWLVSRVDEIDGVLGSLAADWYGRTLTTKEATRAMGAYLRALHL